MTTKPIFVKRLIIPSEHGAWVWLFVPYVVGLLVAPRLAGPTTHAGLAAMLVGLGGLSAFLLRQPATAWMRMRQGRGIWRWLHWRRGGRRGWRSWRCSVFWGCCCWGGPLCLA